MICQYCKNYAEFVCQCFEKFCKSHYGSHAESCSVSIIKKIGYSDKIKILSMELSKRITKINEICCEIVKNTKEITSSIKTLCRISVNKLELLKKKYAKILEKRKLEDTEAELEKEIIFNKIPSPSIKFIKKYFTGNFYSEKAADTNTKNSKKNEEKMDTTNTRNTLKWLEDDHGLIIEAHTNWISALVITKDNKYIISGSRDCTVTIWNLEEKRQEAILRGHTNYVNTVAVTNDNKYIVSGSNDSTIIIWNFQKKTSRSCTKRPHIKCEHFINNPKQQIHCIRVQ